MKTKKTTKTVAAGNGQAGYRRIKVTADLTDKVLELSSADDTPMSPAEARKLAAALNALADKAENYCDACEGTGYVHGIPYAPCHHCPKGGTS